MVFFSSLRQFFVGVLFVLWTAYAHLEGRCIEAGFNLYITAGHLLNRARQRFANPRTKAKYWFAVGGMALVCLVAIAAIVTKAMAGHQAPREHGSTPATIIGDGWVVSAGIGGQQISLLVDTGSANLWLFSSLVSNVDPNGLHQPLYNPSNSTTASLVNGESFNVSYIAEGDWAAGRVYEETVTIAGLTIERQPIGVADSLGPLEDVDSGYSGILGMGFRSESKMEPQPEATLFENVLNRLPLPVFAVDFRTQGDGDSSFSFGENERLSTGDLVEVPVNNSTGQWQVDNARFFAGNDSLDAAPGVSMIFDTGGVTTTIPEDAAAAYWSKVEGAKRDPGGNVFTHPCGARLPELNLFFGDVGTPAVIPGKFLAGTSNDKGVCYGNIAADTTGWNINSGAPFFASHYVLFNPEAPSLSFAPQAMPASSRAAQKTNNLLTTIIGVLGVIITNF